MRELLPYLKTQNARLVRERYQYRGISEYLTQIEPPALAQQYLDFHNTHKYFEVVCAGAKHHHYWEGGLQDHVCEMIGFLLDLYELYPGDMEGVSRSDIIIACYLHDFAKIWQYEKLTDEDRQKYPEKYLPGQKFKIVTDSTFRILDHESRTLLELSKHGITPTAEQWSAVLFAEGGHADANFGYAGRTKVGDTVQHASKLVVLTSMADLFSAMIMSKSLV